MRYLSVCSGIEAATAAWHPLGWEPWAFSEIEKFPAAVLAHHYPNVPNLGDMTKFKEWPDADVSVLVGGTPCQSFSIAGLRKGLDDPRGNLMLTYLAIAGRYRPRWLVWENVPGVLSSNGGRDFGTLFSGLAQLGYGFAYRVLDAQYVRVDSHSRAVPQRRRRVFVVGYLGDWRRAAAVFFERESMSGNPAPRRKAGGSVAGTLTSRASGGGGGPGAGTDEAAAGYSQPVVGTLSESSGHARPGDNVQSVDYLIPAVAHPLRGEGFDGSVDGTGRGTPLVPVLVFDPNQITSKTNRSVPTPELCHTLPGTPNAPVAFYPTQDPISSKDVCHAIGTGSGGGTATAAVAIQERAVSENPDAGPDGKGYRDDGTAYTLEARQTPQVVAFTAKDYGADAMADVSPTLRAGGHNSSHQNGGVMPAVATNYAVRRLTPRECERLQGFPDDFTAIPWRGKTADQCPDGPRYKALGNSMAVNVMRWIGERIQAVDKIEGTDA